MKSKENSFKYAKEMIHKWENSQNSPNPDKLKAYIERLVDAGDEALKTLRAFLREKIDFSEIEEDKHHLVTEGKAVLHTAIVNIDNNIIDLRLQLEADKFNLTDKEFKRGYPEKFANQEFYPESNYYKEWYDPDNDSILICPKGTKGKVIELDGLKITLPAPPPDKECLFHDLPKEEQYWRRSEMPKGLTPETEDNYKKYILEEYRKRREGVWFFNNGEKVWLPPSLYFALQWCKMKDNGGYMDFRYAQLNISYHQLACIVDNRCLGQLFIKSRRTGFTYITIFDFVNEATITSNANFGMTSKTDKDAQEAFAKLTYAYQNLPFFFQPVLKNFASNTKYLNFSKPPDRSKQAKLKKDTSTDDYLNTYIDYKSTSEGSYDGYKMYRYLGDEASKWFPASYQKHWGQISPTFDEGGSIVGKAFLGSTVASRNKGGQEYFDLYKSSKLRDRNKITGRTPSGLYSYFLPAHKNMREFTDKYGRCHEILEEGEFFTNVDNQVKKIGSIEYLEAKRKSKRKKSDIAYNEELRAFPMTVDEAFRDEALSCLFNIEKINQQIDYINQIPDLNNVVKVGNFHWKDGIPDTTVEFKESHNGSFRITWLPPKELQNNYETKIGYGGYSKAPLNEHLGAFGCDSYDISGTVDGISAHGRERENAGSKGALHGVTKMSLSNVPSKHFFLEYVAREKTADKFFENVLMACVFYGMPILAENNKPRLLYHFKNRGYRNFAITRFDKMQNLLSKSEKEIGGIPNSGKDIIDIHSTAIESYIENHIGYVEKEGDYHRMYFERTLKDWLNFDINKRTKFDATISSGLALMAINREKYSPQRQRPSVVKLNILSA